MKTSAHTLHEFIGNNISSHAIFSHRWEDDEVTFPDFVDDEGQTWSDGIKSLAVMLEQLELIWMCTNICLVALGAGFGLRLW